ncbi:recombinase [Sphingobacterium sp. KB22]|uniref:Recombinase n=2 Tax=Sphingobacterium hungaricum TaxID=2082723 RepID=A0A928UVJ9_9SPHI|nr:site-specific integrase [Sphingobacterium hungaricum]MBE8712698.1 recombinase [Sphingobacterium hungaricum]
MKTNFSLLFYLKKPKKFSGGNVPIYVRITVNGKRAELATGRNCNPERWNSKAGKAKGTNEESRLLNTHLDHLQISIYQAYESLIREQENITAETIKNRFAGKSLDSHTLLEAVKDHNNKMKSLVGKEFALGTWKRYKVLESHLKSFMQFTYSLNDIAVKKIDQSFITDFDFYLRSKKSCSNNYVVKNIKNLGKIIQICLSSGWIDRNPLLGYKGKSKTVNRHYLTKEEVCKITDKQFASERLRQIRDVFLFCCYTGLAYIDVFQLKTENINTGPDGERWIFTYRQKTKIRTAIPLLPAATDIIERYSDHPICVNKNSLLPVPSNQKMNEYLKEIAVLCDIDKKLTSHIARHTFATTVTLANGVPIESVSKMLGHMNIKTTQHYAKVLDIKIGEDMAVLKRKLMI